METASIAAKAAINAQGPLKCETPKSNVPYNPMENPMPTISAAATVMCFISFGLVVYTVLASGLLTHIVAVLVTIVCLRRYHLFLPLCAGKINSWARMVLWQTVSTTKLSTAKWTAKRKKSLLIAYLAFHLIKAPFHT